MSQKFQGKIKWYNPEKGYGFIVPKDGGADVFVHYSSLEQCQIKSDDVQEGRAIEYGTQEFRGKVRACDMRLL